MRQGLPAAAQSHISGVNTTGAPRRLGLRTLLGDPAPGQGPGRGMVPPEAAEAAAYYRRQADRIGQRLASHRGELPGGWRPRGSGHLRHGPTGIVCGSRHWGRMISAVPVPRICRGHSVTFALEKPCVAACGQPLSPHSPFPPSL